jgi:hypothetical protein
MGRNYGAGMYADHLPFEYVDHLPFDPPRIRLDIAS